VALQALNCPCGQGKYDHHGDPAGTPFVPAHFSDAGGVATAIVFDSDFVFFVKVIDVEDGGLVVIAIGSIVVLLHGLVMLYTFVAGME
jgi:hypothetical protein